MDDYKLYLEEYSYNKIWSKLSNGDKKILKAMARVNSNSVADILKALGVDANHFNPYRKRLLSKGVLRSNGRGNLEFALPLFDQYVLENEFFERL